MNVTTTEAQAATTPASDPPPASGPAPASDPAPASGPAQPARHAAPAQPAAITAPVVPSSGTLRPLGLDQVQITGGFWAHFQRLNREAIIPHIAGWDERTGWLGNFDAVANGTIADQRHGREFSDSEIYKLLEAMAWEIARTGDAALEEQLGAIVARIAPAQCEDGYLNTRFGNPGQPPRYSDLEWGHELYCYGHLFQAAVARLRSGHHDQLVDVALRAADHVCRTFGEGANPGVCGHPEIEVALVELYRATGERRYLDQAQIFLDRRGHGRLGQIEWGQGYFQDDQPIRDATVLRGHAVRALYLSAGALDAGVEGHDADYVATIEAQYRRTLARRTHVTGGMGSRHEGESFGEDFELPPDRAYCETCAGVASIMVAWRLLLETGDLSYGDVIERTLFNVVATSPRGDGKAFFYTNPLQQRTAATQIAEDDISPRAHAQLRAPWFEVTCCPPNVARTLAQLGTYVATQNAHGVQLVQYASGRVHAQLAPGREVVLQVSTRYPDDGEVAIEVLAAPEQPWALALRVPAWAQGASIEVNEAYTPVAAPAHVVRGLATGDRVVLHLPMAPRWTRPDPRIDALRGTVAVERGPIVFCAESIDLPEQVGLEQVRVDLSAPPSVSAGGVTLNAMQIDLPATGAWPYSGAPVQALGRPFELALIPYYRWANRGPSTMRIWLPTHG